MVSDSEAQILTCQTPFRALQETRRNFCHPLARFRCAKLRLVTCRTFARATARVPTPTPSPSTLLPSSTQPTYTTHQPHSYTINYTHYPPPQPHLMNYTSQRETTSSVVITTSGSGYVHTHHTTPQTPRLIYLHTFAPRPLTPTVSLITLANDPK